MPIIPGNQIMCARLRSRDLYEFIFWIARKCKRGGSGSKTAIPLNFAINASTRSDVNTGNLALNSGLLNTS